MGFIVGLGLAGFLIVVVFFAKLSSLEPAMRTAVIGIRIIFGICTILCLWWWNYEQKKDGRNFLGDLKLNNETFVGRWKASYKHDLSDYETMISFYPDSTFYSSQYTKTGKWEYQSEHEKMSLFFDLGDIVMFKFNKMVSGELHADEGTLIKVSNTPESKENVAKAVALFDERIKREQQEEKNAEEKPKKEIPTEAENEISSSDIEGKWSLKIVTAGGGLTNEQGIFEFNKDGSGVHDTETTISFKLNRGKKRFTVSMPDKVISLNIKSYDGEVLIGYPNEEPDNKYVFTKAL
jgi:hypothetical protein